MKYDKLVFLGVGVAVALALLTPLFTHSLQVQLLCSSVGLFIELVCVVVAFLQWRKESKQ